MILPVLSLTKDVLHEPEIRPLSFPVLNYEFSGNMKLEKPLKRRKIYLVIKTSSIHSMCEIVEHRNSCQLHKLVFMLGSLENISW